MGISQLICCVTCSFLKAMHLIWYEVAKAPLLSGKIERETQAPKQRGPSQRSFLEKELKPQLPPKTMKDKGFNDRYFMAFGCPKILLVLNPRIYIACGTSGIVLCNHESTHIKARRCRLGRSSCYSKLREATAAVTTEENSNAQCTVYDHGSLSHMLLVKDPSH